ncbi:J domain-containing protein [Streptomyces sp. NPDC003016]
MAGRKISGGQRDHYAVLGVEPTASAGQIASAYRRLVRALHPDASPDTNPGTAPGSGEPAVDGRFTDVVAAYGTLRDPVLRAAYDSRLGTRGPKSPPKSPPGRGALIWAGPTRVAAPYDGPGTPRPYPPTVWDLWWKWDAG